MKLLLLLIFTATTLFSQAKQTTGPVEDETGFSILGTCVPTMLFISLFIAGAVYFIDANNKRRGKK
jgi:hypothetical protein